MKDKIVKIVTSVIYRKHLKYAQQIIEQDPSIPYYLLSEGFSDQVQSILYVKEKVVEKRWKKLVDTCYLKMFTSHESYLRFVMFACIREHERNQSVFESFISICALLSFIRTETIQKIGVDLNYLNWFIFVQFYRVVFSDIICRQGGGRRLIEFLRGHRYLKYNIREFPSPDNATADDANAADLGYHISKELKKEGVMEEKIDADEIANDESCLSMAKEVLKFCGAIEHPKLPSYEDVVKRLVKYRKKERMKRNFVDSIVKSVISSVHSDKLSNSIIKSETNDDVKYQDGIQRHESVIEAVIRHNHSKSSGCENTNSKSQEEANGVLQHLKETIEKLTSVLNEFEKD